MPRLTEVETHRTIDPAKAQRFFDYNVVGDVLVAAVLLESGQPDALFALVVFR
jgi:hypothetical protein